MVPHTRLGLPNKLWGAPGELELSWTVQVLASAGTPMRKAISALKLFKRASAICERISPTVVFRPACSGDRAVVDCRRLVSRIAVERYLS